MSLRRRGRRRLRQRRKLDLPSCVRRGHALHNDGQQSDRTRRRAWWPFRRPGHRGLRRRRSRRRPDAPAGLPAPPAQNDGTGRFKDVTAVAGLADRGPGWCRPTRQPAHGPAFAGPGPGRAENWRDGTFGTWRRIGLSASAAFRAYAGDVNKDSFTDSSSGWRAGRPAGPSDGCGFTLAAGPAGVPASLRAFLDYDDDGLLTRDASPRPPPCATWARADASAARPARGAWPAEGGAVDLAAADPTATGTPTLRPLPRALRA
jgi:hypothetical protein